MKLSSYVNETMSTKQRAALYDAEPDFEARSFTLHFSVYRSLTPLKDTGGPQPQIWHSNTQEWDGGAWETGGAEMEKAKDREMFLKDA